MGKTDEEKKDIVAEQNELAEGIEVAEHLKLRLKCNANMLRLCYDAAIENSKLLTIIGGDTVPQSVLSDMALALFDSVIYPEKKRDAAPYLTGVGHALMSYIGSGIVKPDVCEHQALQVLTTFYKYFAENTGEPHVAGELLREFAFGGYEVIRCPHCLMVFDIEKIKSGDISYE